MAGGCLRVNLVAAVNPEGSASSGVRSYVFTLARELVSLGAEVCVLGYGPRVKYERTFEFISVTSKVSRAYEYTFALARFLKRTHVLEGLVHGNRPDDMLPFHLKAPFLPSVLTMHGVHGLHVRAKHGRLRATAYSIAEKRSLNHVRAVICVSRDTFLYYSHRYPRFAGKMQVIPAGVDMKLFRLRSREEARARLRLPEGNRIAAFIGRLEPEKDPMRVVRDFLSLSEAHRDVGLVIVGAGSLAAEIRRVAGRDSGRIRLLDPMPQEELAWLLSAADLLVVASRSEGLPTVAIEALASGIPVVATPVGILPQVLNAGTNGFLLGGSSQLGPLMEKALFEVNWSGEACRASVSTFGWDCIAPAILEVYRAISA